MTDLPAPLTPADCELKNFEYMPLDVQRLRDSRLASIATGDEFMAAVLLWCASWHQVPAASLPDDDNELAKLAGYGRVIKEWRKVRRVALHGWVRCSDDRFYHPVIAEKALEALLQKRDHAWSRECDRIRKENKRRIEAGQSALGFPDRPSRNPMVGVNGIPEEREVVSERIPPEEDHSSCGIPPENALKGTERNGTDREEELRSLPGARELFDRFMAVYPNKAKPDAAYRAWRRAVRGGAHPDEIAAGIKAYPFRDDPKFQPMAANWLDDGGWKIAPLLPPTPSCELDNTVRNQRWLDRLRSHHGDALNGTTVGDVDRVYRNHAATEFTRFLDAIERGDDWILPELHQREASA